MTINKTLKELELLLPAPNYVVHFHLYRLPFSPDTTVEEYVNQVLPAAVIGGMLSTTQVEILEEVEQSLRYNSKSLVNESDEQRFEHLTYELFFYLDSVASKAFTITSFWLKSGHPNYPVFWDFAFIFISLQGVEIFVGSSSD